MARIRTIKPEFPQSESMGKVSRDARLLFIQMWTLADDAGRLRGNSRMLASLLFPYDDDAPSLIGDWLYELEQQNCIVRYIAEDGGNYVAICNWLSHQKIDKASESKLPAPDSCKPLESSRMFANPLEVSPLDQGSRTKDQDQGSGPVPKSVAESSANVRKPKPVAKPDEVDQEVWDDWLVVRKRKRAGAPTKTAMERVAEEARKAGISVAEAIRIAAGREWSGFEAAWLERETARGSPSQTYAQQRLANTRSAGEEFLQEVSSGF